MVTLIIWCPLIEGGTTITAWTITRLIILLVLASILYDFHRHGAVSFSYHPLYIIFVLLGIILTAQTVKADYSYAGFQWFLNYSSMFVVFLAVLKLNPEEKRLLVYTLIASAVFEAGWAIVEYLAVLEPRPNGTFFNPNYLGGYLAGASALLLSEIVKGCKNKEQKAFLILKGIALFLLIVGVSVSGSRGALVAIACAFLFVGLAVWGMRIFPALIVIALLFLLIPNPTVERLKHISEQDIYAWSRLNIWKSAFAMIADNPLGVGAGMYRFYSPRYAFPVDEAFARYGRVAETAHNAYLDIAVELSPLSALAIIFTGIFLLAKALKQARKEKNFLYVGVLGALASVLAHGAVDSIQKSPPSDYLGAISAGMLFSSIVKERTISFKLSPYFKYLSALFIILAAWVIAAPGVGYELSEQAKQFLRKRDFERASRWQEAALAVSPSNADFWYQAAQIEANLWTKNEADDALYLKSWRSLETAQKLNPLNTNYYLAAADLVRRNEKKPFNKRIGAMIELYKKAIELSPYNATFYVELAKVLAEKGDYKEAEMSYRKALELEPRYAAAMALYGDLLAKKGRNKEAIFYYQQALNIAENIASYKNRNDSKYEQILWRFDTAEVNRKLEENSR